MDEIIKLLLLAIDNGTIDSICDREYNYNVNMKAYRIRNYRVSVDFIEDFKSNPDFYRSFISPLPEPQKNEIAWEKN